MRKENVFVKNLKKITQLPFYAHHVRLLTGVVIYGVALAMDKLTAVSGILFLVADIFAIASLAHPEWIVSDVAGKNEDGRTLSVCLYRVMYFMHLYSHVCPSQGYQFTLLASNSSNRVFWFSLVP